MYSFLWFFLFLFLDEYSYNFINLVFVNHLFIHVLHIKYLEGHSTYFSVAPFVTANWCFVTYWNQNIFISHWFLIHVNNRNGAKNKWSLFSSVASVKLIKLWKQVVLGTQNLKKRYTFKFMIYITNAAFYLRASCCHELITPQVQSGLFFW